MTYTIKIKNNLVNKTKILNFQIDY